LFSLLLFFMKHPLLLLLLLPLTAFAQVRPSYSAPRPTYSAPIRTFAPTPYQVQQRTQQQAHQNFQQMQAQQTQRQQQYYYSQQNSLRQQQMQQQLLLRRPLTPQQMEEQQARQQEAEQQATDYLARFAEDQRSQRLAHPAADAQQAAMQQQADARELTAVSIKAYREVFLPGQVRAVMQARALSPKAQTNFQAIHQDLEDDAWWNKQDAAQVNAKLAAHGQALAALTTDLLGFDIASLPPAPAAFSVSALDAQLATGRFDQATATQLMRDAAQAEKRLEGERLARAVQAFKALTATPGATGQPLAPGPKQQQKAVRKSLRTVDKELQRYYAQAGSSRRLYQTQHAILASTTTYLKQEKQARPH
jgi:hypothetical protein